MDLWHRQRGWTGIGYHWCVLNGHRASRTVYVPADDGLIEKGRAESVMGSHAEGHNAHSIGVCLIGPDFSSPQKAMAARLVADIVRRYGLDVATQVKGHRELPHVMKACPMLDMGEFRSQVLVAGSPGGVTAWE